MGFEFRCLGVSRVLAFGAKFGKVGKPCQAPLESAHPCRNDSRSSLALALSLSLSLSLSVSLSSLSLWLCLSVSLSSSRDVPPSDYSVL